MAMSERTLSAGLVSTGRDFAGRDLGSGSILGLLRRRLAGFGFSLLCGAAHLCCTVTRQRSDGLLHGALHLLRRSTDLVCTQGLILSRCIMSNVTVNDGVSAQRRASGAVTQHR